MSFNMEASIMMNISYSIKKRRVVLLHAAAIAVIWGGRCAGAVISFNSRPTFVSAGGVLLTDDYEDPDYGANMFDDAMSGVKGLTQYKTTSQINADEVIAFGNQHVYAGGFTSGSFQLDFTAPSLGGSGVHAVGFDYINDTVNPYVAFVTFADGSSQNFTLHARPFAPPPLPDFFGLTSSLAITQVHLGLLNGGATQSNLFAIDNLSVSAPTAGGAAFWDGGTGKWTDSTHWSINPLFPDNFGLGGPAFNAVISHGQAFLNRNISVSTLTLGGAPGAWTSRVDLTDNALIVQTKNAADKASAIATLVDQITTARRGAWNSGTWDGNGVASSLIAGNANAAMALVDNADLPGQTLFRDQGVDSHSIIVTRAIQGDADLSGTVDAADFDLWFRHVGAQTFSYAAGDLDMSGIVDAADFDIWFRHVGVGTLDSPSPIGSFARTSSVPEPAAAGIIAVGGVALLGCRRRKQSR
jgi:hypothetical protein